MTFRGVYRDGVIIPAEPSDLKNGTPVQFFAAPKAAATPRRGPGSAPPADLLRPTRLTRRQRLAIAAAARGSWADRPDFKGRSSATLAAALRARAARRGRCG